MTKLDWDRERRDRTAREKGTTRGPGGVIRAAPASDKLVERLVKLGYRGPRPATTAQAHALIREARARQEASESKRLREVAAAIERLAAQPRETWAGEVPTLRARLRAAYKREADAIEASRAQTTTKGDRELSLTKEHMRLKRWLRKLELRATDG
jgi:hypothetical protein